MTRLSLRERRLVVWSGMLLLLLAVWMLALKPGLDQRAASLERLQALDALNRLLDQVPVGMVPGRTVDLPPLRQRVAETARQAGIEIRRLDPQGLALSVTLDDVEFAALVGWLDVLTRDQGVSVQSAEISRRTQPGQVSARLLLEGRS